jgi:hypothetical protein
MSFGASKTEPTAFVVLATTYRTMVAMKSSVLDDIKSQLEKGWMTGFVILSTEKNDSHKSILQHLKKIGHEWAASRVLYKLDDENIKDFIRRACMDFDVTHFVDTRKRPIQYVITEPTLTKVKVYQAQSGKWRPTRGWMFRTSPKFYSLLEKASDSFNVIRTGATMKGNM